MTDQPATDTGRAVIDEYLDSIERVLIAAHAPRSERTQVVQDLESQIADMLASAPQPLTEDAVRAVIARLEPPEHFAATYGNGQKETAKSETKAAGWSAPKIGWVYAAAISTGLIPLAVLLGVAAFEGRAAALGGLLLLIALMAAVFAPYALVRAARDLESPPPSATKRATVLVAAMTYSIVVPLLLLYIAVGVTHGAVLMAMGLLAFFYFEYLLLRRVYRRLGGWALFSEPAAPLANGVCAPTA
jgi:hypothetical protein